MLTRAGEPACPPCRPGPTLAWPLHAPESDGLLDLSRSERYLAAIGVLLANALAGIALRLDRRKSPTTPPARVVDRHTEAGVAIPAHR
jgi:hypothetical protein